MVRISKPINLIYLQHSPSSIYGYGAIVKTYRNSEIGTSIAIKDKHNSNTCPQIHKIDLAVFINGILH